MCHLIPHFLCPSVARGAQARALHHLLGLLSHSTLSKPGPSSTAAVPNHVPWMVKRLWLLIPASGSGSCPSQRWGINQRNSLCKEKLQTLGSLRHLFAHRSMWCPKYSVIMVKTTNYTTIRTASHAPIWRQETLTPQPSCQLMWVNNYSKRNVTDAFDFRQSGAPVESKPDQWNQARSAPDYPNTSLFTTDGTIRSEQTVFPSLLHPFPSSRFQTRLLDRHVGPLSASFRSLVQQRAWPINNLAPM